MKNLLLFLFTLSLSPFLIAQTEDIKNLIDKEYNYATETDIYISQEPSNLINSSKSTTTLNVDYEYAWGAVNVHSMNTTNTYSYSITQHLDYDSSNNIISFGVFTNDADFNPEGNSGSIIDDTGSIDPGYRLSFLKKTDENGEYLWHVKINTNRSTIANVGNKNLVIDNNNNIYVSDIFEGTLTIGNYSVTPSVNPYDSYNRHYCILKFSPNGDLLWAKTYPVGAVFIESLAVDENENLYIGGGLNKTDIDLDPGAGVDLQSPPLNPNWSWTISQSLMLIKLDTNGDYVWGKSQFGEGHVTPKIMSMKIKNDKLYLMASVSRADQINSYTNSNNGPFYQQTLGPTDFDPSANSEETFLVGFQSVAVIKLDLDANFIFGKAVNIIDDISFHNNFTPWDIELDSQDNIFLLATATNFDHTIDADPDAGVAALDLTPNFIEGTILIKLDSQGNYINAFEIPDDVDSNNFIVEEPSLLINSSNDLIIGKTFEGQTSSVGPFDIDIDPGAGVFLVNGMNNNTFIASYDNDLNFKWGGQFYNNGGNWFGSSAINNNNQIIFAAQQWYNRNIDMNIFDGEDFRQEPNLFSYLAVYNPITASVTESIKSSINVYPNPSNGIIHINTTENTALEVIDISGKVIMKKQLLNGDSTLKMFEKGIYFLKFSSDNNNYYKKVIIK